MVETSGKSLSAVETALTQAGSQKKLAYELNISEAELSKQISALRRAMPLIEHLGLRVVDAEVYDAFRRLLREVL